MGLMKPGKNEVEYIQIMKDDAGNLTIGKSFIELWAMLDSGTLPVLVDYVYDTTSYFYPKSLEFTNNNTLVFSNIMAINNSIKMIEYKINMSGTITMTETVIS